MYNTTSSDIITSKLSSIVETYGYEVHAFKIGWYNDAVTHDPFKFDLPYDTLVYIIISTPKMFELAFKQYISEQQVDNTLDAIDGCTRHFFQMFMNEFPNNDVEALYDFDMHANHRPKILVQTCAHVAGAARYYQRQDIQVDPWPKTRKIFGVSVHPKYGGWFAMRGVLLFKDILCEDMKPPTPPSVLENDEQIFNVLELFNSNWKDCAYRDVAPHIVERYSEEQIMYFITPTKDRTPLLEKIKKNLPNS